MNRGSNASRSVQYFVAALASLTLPNTMALAQQNASSGYEVTETNVASPAVTAQNAGPVRMARFSLIQGKINCRPSTKVDWAPAYLNQPIRQGEQIVVPANSRAEIMFDDGSIARLGGGAFVTMQTLYSDDKGEFTEVKLNDGLATFRLKNNVDVYQVDSPCCSIKSTGPAEFRIGARNSCEVAARKGNCTVEDHNGQVNLTPGQFVEVKNTDDALHAVPLPPDDSWEHWNEDRDRVYDAGSPQSERYLPPDVALAAPDLDSYGSWHSVPNYGNVWVPRETEAGWRPYHHGHWTWVDPFGWTWVGAESWGWAPYHYGTWVHSPYGWAWAPGPAQQCWSPAVVSFSSYNGSVAWAPLAPEEVVYPSRLAIGFSGGNWSVLFSIGGCGAYYPGPGNRCVQQAWNNVYINRATYVTNYNGYGGRPLYASNYNSYMRAGAFTPRNARFGGGSVVSAGGFAGGGAYNNVSRSNIAAFQHGRAIGMPGNGRGPAVGPANVRPTMASLTPGRSFSHAAVPAAAAAIAARPLYRAALAPRVASAAPAFGNRMAMNTSGRPNAAGHTVVANHPGAPGTSAIRNVNRPGVPSNVQAARRTVGVGNPIAHNTAANVHPGATTNHFAPTNRTNPTAGHVQAAHPIGATQHTSSIHSPTNHSGSFAAHRTTPTQTHTAVTHTVHSNPQTAHVARPAVQPHVQRAPVHVSAPPVQHHITSAPREVSRPQAVSRPQPAPRPQAPPRPQAVSRPQPAPRPQAPPHPQAPPRGGGEHDKRG